MTKSSIILELGVSYGFSQNSDDRIFQLLLYSLLRLDKRSEKAENTTNKRCKRTKARKGEPVEKEPPVGTPKWALSDEWREIIERREQEQMEE